MQIVHKKLLNGTSSSKLSDRIEEITIQRISTIHSQNPVYSTLETLKPGEFSEPIPVNHKVFVFILNQIKNERFLTFEEAQDPVFTSHQLILEKKFIDELKERYNLQLYPENLQ